VSLTAFTNNSKTILSIDVDKRTCGQLCTYCYCDNMIRIYKSYGEKIIRNGNAARENGKNFAKQLNLEYRKLTTSKNRQLYQKMPIRVYGCGDFIKEHLVFLSKLEFKYYIISKNLTIDNENRERLLKLDNLVMLLLSYDEQNLEYYTNIKHVKIKTSYTGEADVFASRQDFKFDIFFNIFKRKIEKAKAAKYSAACPCDSGKLDRTRVCSTCRNCFERK